MKARTTLAGGLLAVATAASLVMSGGTALALPHLASASANPDSNLVDQQTVTVSVSSFPTSDTTVYAAECSANVIKTQDEAQSCDVKTITSGTVSNGAGSFPFVVRAGSGYVDGAGDKCDYTTSCYIVISDNENQPTSSSSTAALASLTFKDTRSASKTAVKAAHKKAKKGKKDTFTATTTAAAAAAGGKVTFTYGSQKKTVNEKTTGKVKATFKIKKSGTVTASFSGNSKYKPSSGKTKVKIKK